MHKRTIRLAVAVVIVVVAGAALLDRRKATGQLALQIVPLLAVAVGFVVIGFIPKAMGFVQAHARALVLTGVAVVAIGFVGPLIILLSAPDRLPDGDWIVWLMIYSLVVGLWIAILPRSAKAMERSRAGLTQLAVSPTPRGAYSGAVEGVNAFKFVGRNWRGLLRVTAPWWLLCCGLLAVFERVFASSTHDKTEYATIGLWALLYFCLPTFHRFSSLRSHGLDT